MISKSFKTLLSKRQITRGVVNTQVRCMGGGPKKPAMSNDERDFDIVVVGK